MSRSLKRGLVKLTIGCVCILYACHNDGSSLNEAMAAVVGAFNLMLGGSDIEIWSREQ